jgi:hypothetical protein
MPRGGGSNRTGRAAVRRPASCLGDVAEKFGRVHAHKENMHTALSAPLGRAATRARQGVEHQAGGLFSISA